MQWLLTLWDQLWRALGWKNLAYYSTAATAAPLSSKRYIRVSCGFACLEGKMKFWVFRKSENTRGLVLRQTCLWGASGPIRMSWKVFMASLRSYLVPVGRFSGKWFCSLPMYMWHTQTWWCKVTARAQLLLSPIGSYTNMQLPAKTRMSVPNHVKIVISSPSHFLKEVQEVFLKVALVNGFQGYQFNYLVCSAALFAWTAFFRKRLCQN